MRQLISVCVPLSVVLATRTTPKDNMKIVQINSDEDWRDMDYADIHRKSLEGPSQGE